MQATNTVVKMNRQTPRINTKADYSDMAVEGRKGRPNTRQRRNMREVKRNWNTGD
ncbi:hypothetical protein MYOV085v1_p0014 [Vibrio phage 355E48.1]|nr:hypothetical protein MYOV085v1_p0014 [Vibrio phage 355E48.1]